jgi:hypothetical protein
MMGLTNRFLFWQWLEFKQENGDFKVQNAEEEEAF